MLVTLHHKYYVPHIILSPCILEYIYIYMYIYCMWFTLYKVSWILFMIYDILCVSIFHINEKCIPYNVLDTTYYAQFTLYCLFCFLYYRLHMLYIADRDFRCYILYCLFCCSRLSCTLLLSLIIVFYPSLCLFLFLLYGMLVCYPTFYGVIYVCFVALYYMLLQTIQCILLVTYQIMNNIP